MKPEVLKSWSLEIDYSRVPCLSADQKARGLWEREWTLKHMSNILDFLVYRVNFAGKMWSFFGNVSFLRTGGRKQASRQASRLGSVSEMLSVPRHLHGHLAVAGAENTISFSAFSVQGIAGRLI